jgi:Polyketide synthase dehydratase
LIIQIDPEADTFLLDHVVDGSPLLPTVMQLDLVARGLLTWAADQGTGQPAGIWMRGIRVGQPLRFGLTGARQLELRCGPAPSAGPGSTVVLCELHSPGHATPHLTAFAKPASQSAVQGPVPGGWAAGLRCGPDLVYPPFFHGPAFRVVGAFGRAGDSLAAVLAHGLPPLRWASEPTVLRPRLLELLMQCCGIAELAGTGRMMVPAEIEGVHWHHGSFGTGREVCAMAVAVPRPGQPDHDRVFDGQVVTPGGTVLLTVTGYRATDLGRPADLTHADRLTRCLASYPDPVPHSLTGTPVRKGA